MGEFSPSPLYLVGTVTVQGTFYSSFIIMPLFVIVLGASSISAAIALYIIRKYDPHA
tara:strand:+ start:510 stop:680 length:171 start_codon:yes stop_codon:yes gene_type:complete